MMSAMTRRAGLAAFGLTTVAASIAAWTRKTSSHVDGGETPPRSAVDSGRSRMDPRERIQRYHLPNVALVTHDGKAVRFYDDLVKDRKVVINFMYTTCADGTCPITTANLVQVQKLLGDRVGRDVFFYSITLSPDQDTPAVLARYARAYNVGPGWTFLTGKSDDIERLRKALGFAYTDPVDDANKTNHVGMVRYGTEPLMIWGMAPGMANPKHLQTIFLWEFDRPLPGKGLRSPIA